jgi:multiple sugar transport system ATP-binding protein
MSTIALEAVSKSFDDTLALDQLSLHIEDGEFFVLLGPTGAGKTTTLRVIAGLEKQESGQVIFDDQRMDGIPPADRDTAFVFQQYSLYPNMTVYENLAFPLKSPLRRVAPADREKRIQEVAETLRISHLLQRKTERLSGGEMQRVSIGRAIVREPRVFLMDEPLSNLDAKLRESLRVELKHLQKSQAITTLFVTHDQIEALTMADHLAVLDQGRLLQVGTPEDIYDRPATSFVAQLVGTPRINLLEAMPDKGQLFLPQSQLRLQVPIARADRLLLGIRPENISIKPEGAHQATVLLTEPLGVETIVHLAVAEATLLALVPGTRSVQVGQQVNFAIDLDFIHVFTPDGQRLSA